MAQRISRFVQYFYFVRFSILLWFLLPVLAFLDWNGITTSFTRGIFALESELQTIWAAFFVVATGMVILITTRVVAVNGQERFGVDTPRTVQRLFGNQSHGRTWWALALTQSAGFGVLGYVGSTSMDEVGMTGWGFLWSSLLGIVAALAFWLVVSLFYSWTYSAGRYHGPGVARTTARAMPLIFPPKWFTALEEAGPPWFARFFARLRVRSWLSYPGYAPSRGAPFWELHYLSIVALWGFILLYLLLLPISAPVTLPWEMAYLFIFGVVPAAALLAGTILTPSQQPTASATRASTIAKVVFIVIAAGVILAWYACIVCPRLMPRAERGMPTVASLMVLAILLAWVLSGFAFFLDRYRVPVLTIVLLVVFLPKLPQWTTGEHYYPALTMGSAHDAAPMPKEVLELRAQSARQAKNPQPVVIITATGGGIHAAGWTAEILSDLETEFSNNEDLKEWGYTLHDNVLLASGVSGGSVGLAQYLREYTSEPPFHSRSMVVNGEPVDDVRTRMTGAANCSSLEAVAWGLEYYDFANLLFTLIPPARGTEFDQKFGPLGYDRSWALERAISRNQTDGHCETTNGLDKVPKLQTVLNMTLAQSVDMLRVGKLPAFTLNTTAAETGDRFLLANYQVPATLTQNYDVLPAESFLHVYGEADPTSGAAKHPYADISVGTAARLSATFPYVSSAARIPAEYAPYAFHFVDGGYFDNDGTSSVIEFLMHAFGKGDWSPDAEPAKQGTEVANSRVPILLIEIRDSWDLNAASNDDSYQRQVGYPNNSPWRALQQLGAPPKALWAAGHTSVTRRNRRELCLLETAYSDKFAVHHIVFDYENPTGEYQPLNWHLTKNQMQLIRVLAGSQPVTEDLGIDQKDANDAATKIRNKLADAANWTARVLRSGLNEQDKHSGCEVVLPK